MEYGIRAEDLAKHPAITGEGCEPRKNLTNKIHPVFARERFSRKSSVRTLGTPSTTLRDKFRYGRRKILKTKIQWQAFPLEQQVYDRLRPALQLASLLLEHSFDSFFCKLVLAEQVTVPGTKKNAASRFDPGFKPTAADIQRARAIFDKTIAPSVHYFFIAEGDATASYFTKRTYGVTDVVEADPPRDIIIELRREFLTYLYQDAEHHSQWSWLSYHYTLANLLVHEICHGCRPCIAPNESLRLTDPGRVFGPEAYFEPDDNFAELGEAWEYHMFHGQLWLINHSIGDPRGMIYTKKGLEDYNWLVDVRSVTRFFEDAHWQSPQPFEIELAPNMYQTDWSAGSHEYKKDFKKDLAELEQVDKAFASRTSTHLGTGF